jgi:hypothetical protein
MAKPTMSPQELQEVKELVSSLDADFGALANVFDEATAEAYAQLDAELQGTDLGFEEAEFGALDLGEDPEADALFLNWIKDKVKKLIQKLVALVKKYKTCAHCVPKVATAVALFKAGKYSQALKAAYDAYNCIRKCM